MPKINPIYPSARRWLCLLIALSVGTAHAVGPCQQALAIGERVQDSARALDTQTMEDLDVDALEQMLAPYLQTDFGRRRWAFALRHPDLANVRERQDLVRYLAGHLDDFKNFENHFGKMGAAEKHILDQFLKLEKNEETMAYDVMWTIYVWACNIGPAIGHYFFDLPAYASFLIAGQAWGTSMSNVKRVRKVRDLLGTYRVHLEGAELAHAPLQIVPNPIARELASVLDPHPDPAPVGLAQKVRRLYDHAAMAFFNRGPDRFGAVRRRLRQMEPIVGTTVFGFPIAIDISLIWDRFFISNYRLRDLQAKLVDHKEDMAALFSALGEFEMFLGLAKFYDANRKHTTFLKIVDGETQLEARQARAPLMAQVDYANTVPNNLSLGAESASVEVLLGETHQGARTRAKLFGQINLMTLAGMPVFAQSGSMTPNFVVSQLTPVRAPRGVMPFHAEATRWAEIQTLTQKLPRTLVLLHEPFASAGEDRQLALRSQILRELGDAKALAVVVTRTRQLSQAIEDWPGIARRQMADYQAVPFQTKRGRPQAPDAFQVLLDAGVAPEFVVQSQLNLEQIARGGPVRRWRQNVIPFRPVSQVSAPARRVQRKTDTHRQ